LQALRGPLVAVADRCRERGLAETERLLGRRGKVLAAYEPALSGLPGQEAYPEPVELPADAARLRLFSYLADTFAALAEEPQRSSSKQQAAIGGSGSRSQLEATGHGAGSGSDGSRLAAGSRSQLEATGHGAGSGFERLSEHLGSVLHPSQESGDPEARRSAKSLDERTHSPRVREKEELWFQNPDPGSRIASDGSRLSARSPLILLLDDLQWAEELTLGFLEHWLRVLAAGGEAPLLVVGAYRSEEVGAQSGGPLQRLLESPGVEAVPLGRLEEPAVASIVGDMLALEPAPRLFARHLARHSEGNPFFVAEYLRAAVAEGLLWREQGVWQVAEPTGQAEGGARREEPAGTKQTFAGARSDASRRATAADYEAMPLPTTLRDLVSKRLDGLGRDARRLAEAAAVLGRESDLAVLGPMLGTRREAPPHDEALLDALDELLRRQVLEVPTPGRLRFVHDKIREVAYMRLRKDRRKSLHRAAAESITSGAGLISPAEQMASLGHHWEQAGKPEDARPCYLNAARRARHHHDYAESERLYRAYLRLTRELTIESVVARRDLVEWILRMRGRYDEALQEGLRTLEEAGRLGDRRLEGQCLGGVASVYQETYKLEPALELFARALDLARGAGDRHTQGTVLNGLCNLYSDQGRLDEARQAAEQALDLFRQEGNREREAVVLSNLAGVHWNSGDLKEGRRLLEQALMTLREMGNRFWEGTVLGNLGAMLWKEGRQEEGLRCLEQALAIHQEMGNRRFEVSVLCNLGGFHNEQGHPEQAKLFLQQALHFSREMGLRHWEAVALFELATTERLGKGNLREAARRAKQSEQIFLAAGNQMYLALTFCEEGCLELAGGRSGRELLERAQVVAESVSAGPESELGRIVSELRRAVEAFEAGEHHRLFRGQLIEDLPEGLRRWLRETGQLPAREEGSQVPAR
jgi:tetratricopeptide (TPR) repeat protein